VEWYKGLFLLIVTNVKYLLTWNDKYNIHKGLNPTVLACAIEESSGSETNILTIPYIAAQYCSCENKSMDKVFKKPIKHYKILDDRSVTSKCPILRVHNAVCFRRNIKYFRRWYNRIFRVNKFIPVSRPTDATCDRFLFSIYMFITLHVSNVKRSSSGVPHRTYSLQFLCLCLSAALTDQQMQLVIDFYILSICV
jgi:hypothetical protein